MLPKPRSLTPMGIVQLLLASSFVVWLLFFPDKGVTFAWPVVPTFTAMFIGASFISRAYIGFHLWRARTWPELRWQAAANYAFLAVVFAATAWHLDEMNWTTNIIIAHVWVLAYFVEPIMLYLVEPRGPEAHAPLPAEKQRGPLPIGLKRVDAAGLITSFSIGAIAFINPQFLDTRWPWPLDPFDARVMAAFFALAAFWCLTIYNGENWGEIRLAVGGTVIFALANFAAWLVMLPSLDPNRVNIYAYGIVLGVFGLAALYYFVRLEWLQKRV